MTFVPCSTSSSAVWPAAKYFGGSDWYREGAAHLLKAKSRERTGEWTGGIGESDISSALAVLFLTRGQYRIPLNKLMFDSLDAHRKVVSAAMAKLSLRTGHARAVAGPEHLLRRDGLAGRQLLGSCRAVNDAGSLHRRLTGAQLYGQSRILRQYVRQGGTIFSCTEGNSPGDSVPFYSGIRRVYKRLFPDHELVEVPSSHTILSMRSWSRQKGPPLFMISNGVRPLVIHTDQNLPRSWAMTRFATAIDDFKVRSTSSTIPTPVGFPAVEPTTGPTRSNSTRPRRP